jgi:nucleoside-diphosphate-sugar epimerase
MRLLVLGRTAWLGRHITATAVERGHRVTCLARGESGVPPPGAAFTRADRDGTGAYREVTREEWDVVIDVSRQPGQVRRATATLADRAGSLSLRLLHQRLRRPRDTGSRRVRRPIASTCMYYCMHGCPSDP